MTIPETFTVCPLCECGLIEDGSCGQCGATVIPACPDCGCATYVRSIVDHAQHCEDAHRGGWVCEDCHIAFDREDSEACPPGSACIVHEPPCQGVAPTPDGVSSPPSRVQALIVGACLVGAALVIGVAVVKVLS